MNVPQFPTLHETPTIVPPGQHSTVESMFSQNNSASAAQAADTVVPSAKKSSMFNNIRLGAIYMFLFFAPIAGAYGLNSALANSSTTALASSTANDQTPAPQDYQQAVPASVESTNAQGNDLEYELSLANGFLQKAVKTSNASPNQTVEEKNTVIQLLNQALEAANRAVALAPNDARGYSSRGRVYQATSTIKPEMKALADADFAKAAQLGATDPSQAPSTQDPMQLLPTEQATTGQQAKIAAPEESSNSTVTGQEGANAKRGTVTLQPGTTEVFVPYSSVKSDTQLYVNADVNPENLTLYVKNKEEGVGFTIASTAAPSSTIDVTWWEIE